MEYTYINATESESEIIFNLQPFNNTKNLKFQYLSDASVKIIKKDYFREISLGIINNKSKVELMFNDFKLNLLSKLKDIFQNFIHLYFQVI